MNPFEKVRVLMFVLLVALGTSARSKASAPGDPQLAHRSRVAGSAAHSDALPEGISSSDWMGIRAAYDTGRHTIFAARDGFVARNPGQQWRTMFDGRGFMTSPDAGSWTWGLQLVGYGREGAVHPLHEPICVDSQGDRVSYRWNDALTEWFVNDRRGLEHGYTLQHAPDGDDGVDGGRPNRIMAASTATGSRCTGLLQLTLAIRGPLHARIDADGRGITFINDAGVSVVNYSGLIVCDADGMELPAWFESNNAVLRLCVDDICAHYPLTVDPLAQQAYLKASNADSIDQFGYSVAASGDTVVVGALYENSSATGVNGNQSDSSASEAGAAYVFVRNGSSWIQQAYLKASNTGATDHFGMSVAISGDTVVVGAPGESSSATGVNGNQSDNGSVGSGAVYVFARSGGVWAQQVYLKASNTGMHDRFGHWVSLSGDTLAAGAPYEDSISTGVNGAQNNNSAGDSGAAYVFARNGTTWSQQAYLKASNTGITDRFGSSLSTSGNTVAVGGYWEDSNGNQADNSASNSGAVYVFVSNAGVWSQQAYIKASNVGASDQFGWSVAVAGDVLVVGATNEDSNATGINGNQSNNSSNDSGAAYVFIRVGTSWLQHAYLKASNTDGGDQFGYSVSASGNIAVISALGESSCATGVNGDQSNNGASLAGAAYVFLLDGATWTQQAYIKSSNTDAADYFGASVCSAGDIVIVGAPREDSNASGVNGNQGNNSFSNAGAAYVYNVLLDGDNDSVRDEIDNCPLDANTVQEDADGDGAGDACDECPGTPAGLAVDTTGRPLRDCNTDCIVDGDDVQCITDELLSP